MPPSRNWAPLLLLIGTVTTSAQTIVQWQAAANGAWFTPTNWIGSALPTNGHAAISVAGGPYTVTASGSTAVNVTTFDLGASGATALFDFSSTGLALNLGTGTSNWTAGTAEFRTSAGLYGNGTSNTSLNLSSGVELLYSTSIATRNLYNLTVANAGTIHATSGVLSISSTALTNQSGGLIHADGAEIDFASNVTLVNSGTIRATGSNGKLYFNTTETTANLGAIDLVNGGHAYLQGTVNNTSATLNAPTGGSFELLGGTINGGIIAPGAVTFTGNGGYLSGATLNDDLTLPASTYVRLTNNASVSGGNIALGNSSSLYWQQSATLAAKTITWGTGSIIYLYGGNSTLTLDSATTGSGDIQIYSDGSAGIAVTNQGNLTHTSASTGYLYAPTLTNSGTVTNAAANSALVIGSTNASYQTNNSGNITVNASGATIYLDGNLDNTGGTLNATNGQLIFRGNNTTAHLNGGTLNVASGAHAYLNGTIANGNTTLNAPASGQYELYGGTITGGTIAPGTLAFTGYGGYLDGATLNQDLTLPTSTYVRLTNGATFTGGNLTLGTSSSMYWQQVGTMAGKTVTLGDGSSIYVNGGNSTLTLANTVTATGDLNIYTDGSTGTAITNQGTLTHTSSSNGTISALSLANSGTITNAAANSALFIGNTYSAYNTTNTGNIAVNAGGATIYLDGNVDNTGGTLNALNGELIFRGNNTTAHLTGGTINVAAGAHAYLNGTIANGNTTLSAPTTGTFELDGGTISGGAIAPGALMFTPYGGYLDRVTLNADLTLPTSAYVRLTNGATFTGGNLTLGTSSSLYWQQAGTMAAKSVTLGNGSSIYVNGGNSTLTLANTVTATGDLNIYTDGSTGTAITNQGTLTHTSSSNGTISALSLTNSGTITNTAPNSSLFIGNTYSPYNTTNTGNITVNASGATIYLDGNVDSTSGTLNAMNGQLVFRGNNTSAHLNGAMVNVAAGAHAYLNGTIANGNATLAGPTTGIFELQGGTITGGTIAPGAVTFTAWGGYLDGTNFSDDLTLPASSYVRLINNAVIAGGNITLNSSSGLYWQQAGTFSGKTLTFGNGSYVYVAGGNSTLTLDPTTTASGQVQIYTDGSTGTAITNQGTITHTSSSSGSLYALQLSNTGSITVTGTNTSFFVGSTSTNYNTTNTGNITVNGAGTNLYLDGNLDNTGGTLTATAGQFIFRGNNTTAHLNGGTLNIASGAHAYLNGTLDNTGSTLNPPASGQYELDNGTITGGIIAPGALTFTQYGGYLDGATLNDNLTLPISAYVRLTNNSTFSGANATFGNSSGVYWQQSGALNGKTLTLGGGAYVYVVGGNSTFTLGPTSSLTGDANVYTDGSSGTAITIQGNITQTSTSSGMMYARTLTNSGTITNSADNTALFIGSTSTGYDTFNTGNLTVNGNSSITYLDGNIDNTGGTLNATNGAFVLRGNNTTAHLNGGTTNIAAAGHVYLDGTLDNSAATLAAPASGMYELYGGTINNGTVAAGALSFTSSNGTLNNVTLLGNVAFPANSHAYFTGGTNLGTATATLDFASGAGLYWQQAGTISGHALTFGANTFLYVSGANNTVTLDPTSSATGEVQIYSDGSAGTAITNEGSITHSTGTGNLYAMTFTNAGNITVTGGTMYLGAGWTGASIANNSGAMIRLAGGNVYLQQPVATPLVNNGIIDVQSGTFYTNNRLSNGSAGTISGAGTINGNIIISGGAISPGNNGVGALTIANGTLTVAGAATFAVDIGGANSDQLVFQNPGGVINIGSGLLALSLNLLSAPTANTTFNLITISSGGSGISGSFAGLPNTGDSITANFGGNPFTFTVNYQPNFVSLAYNPVMVPEPSTYALLGFGLLTLAIVARPQLRRRPFGTS